jgi:hypothetical protein
MRVNTGLYCFVKLGDATFTGLKILGALCFVVCGVNLVYSLAPLELQRIKYKAEGTKPLVPPPIHKSI